MKKRYVRLKFTLDQLDILIDGIQMVKGNATGFEHLVELVLDCEKLIHRLEQHAQKLEREGDTPAHDRAVQGSGGHKG